jgi:hypothetical protein
MGLNYLTVQDVLLLDFVLTKSRRPFDALKLEEAVYCQYAPGESTDVARQGARLLTGFASQAPFGGDSRATAFASLVAFLKINGKALALSDSQAPGWVAPLFADRPLAEQAIRERLCDSGHGVPDVEEVCNEVVLDYAKTLASLSEAPNAAR